MTLYRQPDPFPPRMSRLLTYCINNTFTSAAVQYQLGAEIKFLLNAIFDTNATGGGHQPYGYDQMAALYSKYLVHKTSVNVIAQTVSGSGAMALGFSVQSSSNTTDLAGEALSDVIEKSMNSVMFLDCTGATRMKKFAFQMHTVEGITKSQYNDDLANYGALVTANPILSPILRIALSDNSGASAITLNTSIILQFEVEFYDRLTLAASN